VHRTELWDDVRLENAAEVAPIYVRFLRGAK